jgi:hypothetical protein
MLKYAVRDLSLSLSLSLPLSFSVLISTMMTFYFSGRWLFFDVNNVNMHINLLFRLTFHQFVKLAEKGP